jgi:hypothetical protein
MTFTAREKSNYGSGLAALKMAAKLNPIPETKYEKRLEMMILREILFHVHRYLYW